MSNNELNGSSRIGSEDAVERLAAIRKRRAAITPGPYSLARNEAGRQSLYTSSCTPIGLLAHFRFDQDAEFIANAPADIDYLLVELAASKENADHLRKSCEMLSESVLKLTDEVERLRAEKSGLLDYVVDLSQELGLYEETGNPPVKEPASFMEELRALDQALVTTDDEQEDG